VDLLEEFEGKKTLVSLEKTVYWALLPTCDINLHIFQVSPLNVGFHEVTFGD
jgi:hypothetical protein